jgi:hypothetical protein
MSISYNIKIEKIYLKDIFKIVSIFIKKSLQDIFIRIKFALCNYFYLKRIF